MPVPVTIVNVGYRSTNFWVVSAGRSRLLIDLGWPGMVSALTANLTRCDIPFREVTHGVATHYHMDHAGAAQDLKDAGMRLIVDALPDGRIWSGFGYVLAAIGLLATTGIVAWRAFK